MFVLHRNVPMGPTLLYICLNSLTTLFPESSKGGSLNSFSRRGLE